MFEYLTALKKWTDMSQQMHTHWNRTECKVVTEEKISQCPRQPIIMVMLYNNQRSLALLRT